MPDTENAGPLEAEERKPRLRHDPPALPGYRLEQREAIPLRRLNRVALSLVIPIGVLFYLTGALIVGFGNVDLGVSVVALLVLAAVVLIVVPLVHELIHGAVAVIVGARPFYGIGQGYAYTSFREPVTPRQYAAISVAPLVVLTALSLLGFALMPGWFLAILALATTNAVGAVGDVWILKRVWQLPSDALIYDLADGYAAFVPE